MAIGRRQFICSSAWSLCAGAAWAQPAGFPSHLVNLVVPWPAGNPTDAIARLLAPLLGKDFEQPLIVENVVGAGGALGAQKVLNAPPDGHAMLLGTTTDLVMTPLALSAARFKSEDFRLVGTVGRTPYALTGRPDLPAADLGELLAVLRKPGAREFNYGSIGPGSLIHVAGARFAQVAAVPMLHVPYKGLPPMIQELMGGQIDLAFLPLAGNVPALIEQGKLRFYGVTAPAPNPRLPRLVTLASQDKAFLGFDFDVWAALALPRKTPEPVQARLHRAFYAAMQNTALREWLESTGSVIAPPMTLAELDAFFAEQIQLHTALTKTLGLQPS
jgi:tripartite-type tricarboxylate transporter receptor subunit TctC